MSLISIDFLYTRAFREGFQLLNLKVLVEIFNTMTRRGGNKPVSQVQLRELGFKEIVQPKREVGSK